MNLVELWALSFVATVVLEVPIVALGVRGSLGLGRAVALGVGLQLLTHPALWFLAPRFGSYAVWVTVMEIAVTLTEGLVLAAALRLAGEAPRAAWLRGLGVSVLANLLSTAVGLLAWS